MTTDRILQFAEKDQPEDLLRAFFNFPINEYERLLKKLPTSEWMKRGQTRALHIFHRSAKNVPAYKDFLRKHGVKPASIKTFYDFEKLPVTTKENYINRYSASERSWGGKLLGNVLAMSSGTTGNPKLWPRSTYQDIEAAVIHELLYRQAYAIHHKKTLLVIGFPMGVYVSGVATVLPSWLISQKSQYDLTVVTAGYLKSEILRIIEAVKADYEQVVLIGHPFFLKDIIETGNKVGMNWEKRKVSLMFCSEGFSEQWRKYIMDQAGIAQQRDGGVMSTYGSAEMLLMGFETSLTIRIRQLLNQNPILQESLFRQPQTPNIFQYNPLWRYIESIDDELVFTSDSGTPLVRFNMHDRGRVLLRDHIEAVVPKKMLLKRGSGKSTSGPWNLPFVVLWGRSDNTMIFYGANIYPEHIHAGLNQEQFLPKITGKFVMSKTYRKNMEETLEVNIELANGAKPSKSLQKSLATQLTRTLESVNAEYLFLSKNLDKDIALRVKLWEYQHPHYFKPGLKPKYIAT